MKLSQFVAKTLAAKSHKQAKGWPNEMILSTITPEINKAVEFPFTNPPTQKEIRNEELMPVNIPTRDFNRDNRSAEEVTSSSRLSKGSTSSDISVHTTSSGYY
jgi:hypothetical protein